MITDTITDLDLTGSGNETISHIYENQRLTILFSAFTGPPQILRLWGRATVHERGSSFYNSIIPPGGDKERELNFPGLRAIIWLDIEQVGTSCGYSVPYYDFREYRRTLEAFADNLEKKGEKTGKWEDGWDAYWAFKNQKSNDGLPGMKRAMEFAGEKGVKPMEKFVGVKEVYGNGKEKMKVDGLSGRPMTLVMLGIILGVLLTHLFQFAKSAGELYQWPGVQDMLRT